MSMIKMGRRAFALLTAATVFAFAPQARALDNVIVGTVSSGSANTWPMAIGVKKGFFTEVGINIDYVLAQSNAAVVQQLTGGSTNVGTSVGLVDPIRAIDKGAPLAIVRIEIQAPPYALVAKNSIKKIEDLKGKTIIIGGAKDITRIFVESMLKPHGLNPGGYDFIFAGATSARFSALQSGAVDAAILTTPFNFYAESAGFVSLGDTIDYLKDMPFAGMVVNRTWAEANPKVVERLLAAFTKSVLWFEDKKNRDESVQVMMELSKLSKEDVEKAYDYLQGKHLFEPTGKTSKAKLLQVVNALRELGDIPADFKPERLLLPGVTQVVD
jgi:ABC-type nitrate/sulfonate/bicarbonate transport system substrate-binding protein